MQKSPNGIQTVELQGFLWIFAFCCSLQKRVNGSSHTHWCNDRMLQLSYVVIQNTCLSPPFYVVPIKPRGVCNGRRCGRKERATQEEGGEKEKTVREKQERE